MSPSHCTLLTLLIFYLLIININMNINMTAGYLKDAGASLMFILLFLLVISIKDLNKYRTPALIGLFVGFLVDFSYTSNPYFHETKIGYNIPCLILGLAGIMIFFVLSWLMYY